MPQGQSCGGIINNKCAAEASQALKNLIFPGPHKDFGGRQDATPTLPILRT